MKNLPIEEVQWRDAYFDFEVKSRRPQREDYIVKTVGYILHENELFLTLAQECLPNGDGFRAVTRIPKSMILSREVR